MQSTIRSRVLSKIKNSPPAQRIKSLRSSGRRWVLPLIVLALLGLVGGAFYLLQMLTGGAENLTYSGTIEATEIRMAAEGGGRIDKIEVVEGELVEEGQTLAVVRGEKIRSPISGTVLYRLAEPGEFAAPGSPLVIISNLDALTLTVYLPEDIYGKVHLGQSCHVYVDSYPGEVFAGTVNRIADQAEFTPRNIQTVENRKNTVYAVRISLAPAGGKLKPGMPADARFLFEH